MRYHLRHFNISNFSKLITPPLFSWNCRLYKVWVSNLRQQKNEYPKCTFYNFSGNTNLLGIVWYVQNRSLNDKWELKYLDFGILSKIFRNSSKITMPFVNSGTSWHTPKEVDISRRQWNSQKSEFRVFRHLQALWEVIHNMDSSVCWNFPMQYWFLTCRLVGFIW